MKKIGIIGAGSFGTSLAIVLRNKGHEVTIWSRRKEQIEEMREKHTNERYLPGIHLPDGLEYSDELKQTIQDKDLLLFAVPTQVFRSVFKEAIPFMDESVPIVNVSKGIEKGSLLRLSQVAKEIMPKVRYLTLSGPSHAEEVAMNMPTTVVVASDNPDLAKDVQDIFITERFRVYTNDDIIGVEIGGALKNIVALGAGISDGMGFGDNAKAAMMTRGLTEMSRLGIAMGAQAETFSGLTGLGDLIVTCTSVHSRNRRCGILIGQGKTLGEAVSEVGMVVEGISTAEATQKLAQQYGIEMPITQTIYGLIHGTSDAKEAVSQLMEREKKNEM